MATTINSNTTDGVVITPDTSGEIELQANGVTKAKITANGLQDNNGNSLRGGSFRNFIINGDMNIAQRGTSSGSVTSNGYSSLDRWYVNASGGTYTLSQEAFTVGQTDVPNFPEHYLRLAVSTGNNNAGIHQRVENVATLGGKTVTLSFWAKGTNPAGGSFVSSWIQNFGSGGSSTVETLADSSIVLTSSWQKFTITFDVPSISGKTIGTSSYTWVELLRQPSGDTGTSAWTADIAQVQLEVGEGASDFEHLPYDVQLQRCYRYYFKMTANAIGNRFACAMGDTTSNINSIFNLPTSLRDEPSVSYSNINLRNGSTDETISAIFDINNYGNIVNVVWAVSTTSTTGAAYMVRGISAGSYVEFISEL